MAGNLDKVEGMRSVISDKQQEALDHFGFMAAVPLFCIQGETADHLATGIFISVHGRLFLVTARHILDRCRPEDIAITASPEGSRLQTLGTVEVCKPIDLPTVEIDIVAIEIRDEAVRETVTSGWRGSGLLWANGSFWVENCH